MESILARLPKTILEKNRYQNNPGRSLEFKLIITRYEEERSARYEASTMDGYEYRFDKVGGSLEWVLQFIYDEIMRSTDANLTFMRPAQHGIYGIPPH